MLFAIRDDDTSYFTSKAELTDNYERLWSKCPISLSVIPFDVPTFHRGGGARFYQLQEPVPLADNQQLVKFLKTAIGKGTLHAMLHGYNHLYKVLKREPYDARFLIPEFLWVDNPAAKIAEGRMHLERVLQTSVSEFVPPSNSMSPASLRGLGELNLNLSGTVSWRTLLRANAANCFPIIYNRLRRRYPYCVCSFLQHKEISCYTLSPSCHWQGLKERLRICAMKNGSFVVATHYWELGFTHLTEKVRCRELLLELVAIAESLEAEFVSLKQVFARG